MPNRTTIKLVALYTIIAVVATCLGYFLSDVPWLIWVLLGWLIAGLIVAVIMERGIRMADRKEGTQDPEDPPDDEPPTTLPPDWKL